MVDIFEKDNFVENLNKRIKISHKINPEKHIILITDFKIAFVFELLKIIHNTDTEVCVYYSKRLGLERYHYFIRKTN